MQKDKKKYDVIICGGGPAGIASAIAAARQNANVLLIEATGCLGGMLTSGLLSFWASFDDMDRHVDAEVDKKLSQKSEKTWKTLKDLPVARRIVRGIAEEILNRLVKAGGAIDFGTGCVPVNPEKAKHLFDVLMKENGITVLYFTQAIDVIKKGKIITGIITASKAGLKTESADMVIDASGDGDIAALCGCPFKKGREEDGQMQGVTLVFRLGGVKYFGRGYGVGGNSEKYNEIFRKAWQNGIVSGLYHLGCINAIPGMSGVVAVNSQHSFGIDATKPVDLTKAMMDGRRQIQEMTMLFKKYCKGFEQCFLIDTAALPGVRETRRIQCEYELTEKDVLEARKFKDSIGKYAWTLDVHLPPLPNEKPCNVWMKPNTSFDIPFRCLVPKGIDNLLVAGRCFSATQKALGAARLMPTCMVMGQAAGTAAALCVKSNIITRNLKFGILRKALLENGAFL